MEADGQAHYMIRRQISKLKWADNYYCNNVQIIFVKTFSLSHTHARTHTYTQQEKYDVTTKTIVISCPLWFLYNLLFTTCRKSLYYINTTLVNNKPLRHKNRLLFYTTTTSKKNYWLSLVKWDRTLIVREQLLRNRLVT